MTHPQTLAQRLYNHFPTTNLKQIKANGCCAFVLLWCMGIEPEDIDAIMTVDNMIKADVIKPNCIVKWFESVRFLTGRELVKVDFAKINTIHNIKERTPVYFQKNPEKEGHWVGVENGEIKFNPLKRSVNVEEGRPTEARFLFIKGDIK